MFRIAITTIEPNYKYFTTSLQVHRETIMAEQFCSKYNKTSSNTRYGELFFVYRMARLCEGAHEISGIPAPLCLCGWVVLGSRGLGGGWGGRVWYGRGWGGLWLSMVTDGGVGVVLSG